MSTISEQIAAREAAAKKRNPKAKRDEKPQGKTVPYEKAWN